MIIGENSWDKVNFNSDISTKIIKFLSPQESNIKSNKIHHSKNIINNNEGKAKNAANSNINNQKNFEIKENKDKNL